MIRFIKIFVFALTLSLGFASLASAYSFGGFNKIGSDDLINRYNFNTDPYQRRWQHLYKDDKGLYHREDWLAANGNKSFELFVIGGQSKYATTLASKTGDLKVEFSDTADFDGMTKYYQNVMLDDLYFTRYNAYTRQMENNDFIPLLTTREVDTSVHPEGVIRCGLDMYIAMTDMIWMDVEIKKDDILLGFDHYYDYVNGKHVTGETITFTDMVLVLRGPSNTPAVPIPGAVWLLGSGIAGITALRRKMK